LILSYNYLIPQYLLQEAPNRMLKFNFLSNINALWRRRGPRLSPSIEHLGCSIDAGTFLRRNQVVEKTEFFNSLLSRYSLLLSVVSAEDMNLGCCL
jgi:hypothetical protein